MNWRHFAACLGAAPAQFDPIAGQYVTDADRARADHAIATYCSKCPVVTQCLDDALRLNVQGVRGGRLLEDEHGSMNGYLRHRRRGEEACDDCKAAAAAYQRDRAEKNKRQTMRSSDFDFMRERGLLQAVSA